MRTIKVPKISSVEKRIAAARRTLFNYEGSDAVFDSISPLWFSGKKTERNLTQVATQYVFSTFVLHYLEHVTLVIQKKLKIKGLSTDDLLENSEKLEKIKTQIAHKSDNQLMQWVNNECIPVLTKLTLRLNVSTHNDLARLANLLQRELKILDYSLKNDEDRELLSYDVFYNVLNKIKSFGYLAILDRTTFDEVKTYELKGPKEFTKIVQATKEFDVNDRRIVLELTQSLSLKQVEVNPVKINFTKATEYKNERTK